MNHKYFLIFITTCAAITYLFFAKKISVQKDFQTVTVGTSADYQPFSFIDTKTNEIVGFDIDVAREVCNRLHKKMILKDIPFASLIFGILSQDIDIIAAGMSPTPNRAETVSFSNLYIEPDPFMIITKKSNTPITSIDGLTGKKVAVNSGYTAESYLSDKAGIELVRLTSPADSMLALKSGAVDAFVCARSVTQLIVQQQSNASDFSSVLVPNTGDGCALAVNKNNQALLESINLALDSMQQDGTLDKLKAKWNLK